MSSLKILHVISTYKPAYVYGGPIVSISKLCESLSALKDISIRLITTNANGRKNLDVAVNKEVNIDGVTVIYFKRITGDPHETSPRLWQYLIANANEYDVIHIHAWWNLVAMLSAFICVIKGKKLVISPRGMLSNYIFQTKNSILKSILHSIIGKFLLSKSYYHATSQQESEECRQLIKKWQGFVIPNLIELPQIALAKQNNIPFTIGFLSRIDPKKGLEFVFKAMVDLPFPIFFKIAGYGDNNYINQLKQLADQLGIADKIEWRGWKDPEEKFYEIMNFDLFVLTSFNENFANVVIEALHMGTPVCISRGVGLADFVEKHDVGWVTDLTISSVKEAILDAYSNRDKRKRIEEEARTIITSQFSEKNVIQQYIEMYITIIEK